MTLVPVYKLDGLKEVIHCIELFESTISKKGETKERTSSLIQNLDNFKTNQFQMEGKKSSSIIKEKQPYNSISPVISIKTLQILIKG